MGSLPQPSLPPVLEFSPNARIDDVVAALKLSGGCVIRNLLSEEDIKNIETEIRPSLEADEPWQGNFFPTQTRRCYGMFGKSPTAAAKMAMNPLYQGVCKAMLEERYWCWSGSEKIQAISPPQLNNSIGISVRPGSRAQPLHRDDICHLKRNKRAEVYPDISEMFAETRDNLVGFFIAGKKATKENGATRFIPGSHLWEHEREPDESLAVYAELNPGDGFMMLGSAYHGGSANTTENEERLLYSCFMIKGYLRQEENQYLSIPLSTVKSWPIELQKIVG